MTRKLLIVYVLLILSVQVVSSQNISLGATYTNTSAYFLKSVPGITLGYDHQIWRFSLFANAYAGKKHHSYSEAGVAPGYSMQIGYGEIFKGNLNLGIALNALSSDHYRISFGAFLGLNYLRRQENIKQIYFDPRSEGNVYNDTIDEWYKNRLGWGVSLEVELKQVIIERLSLLTRIEAGQTSLEDGDMPRGISFLVWGYNSFTFSFGLKYSLKRKNASP
jgi:hypothetical protein